MDEDFFEPGREFERALIVAWLREVGRKEGGQRGDAAMRAAAAIEHGDHKDFEA